MTTAEIIKSAWVQPQQHLHRTLVVVWHDGKLMINGQEADPGVIEFKSDGYTYRSSVKIEVR
jgi:hypothetical protein